jgi:8-oxo-dGTP pyrophosphatase MutT (NUDIX family)
MTTFVDAVSFMLIRDGAVLAERRKLSKRADPGVLSLPGGHVEAGESHIETLYREAREEMAIDIKNPSFVCTLLHRSVNVMKLHYYAITEWQGEIETLEAQSLHWIPIDQPALFDLDVCKVAVREYQRIYS